MAKKSKGTGRTPLKMAKTLNTDGNFKLNLYLKLLKKFKENILSIIWILFIFNLNLHMTIGNNTKQSGIRNIKTLVIRSINSYWNFTGTIARIRIRNNFCLLCHGRMA